MDTHAYPGSGLSLSQLVFALNKELERTARSPLQLFTFDDVSQLDRDISTALVTTHEWKNSFARVNRVPLDVLSLIPTHLSSQKDRFCATFVCRHWRRTFLQQAVLWSQLYLSKGEIYTKTLLERSKGSALEITTNSTTPAGTTALLPTHTAQIRYLDFERSCWRDIQRFLEISPGPFPLLHTLRIHAAEFNPEAMTPPSLHLFHTAINLKELSLYSSALPFLSHLTFPNLTTLKLSIEPAAEEFHASQLFNFLKASPMLRTVYMRVPSILLEGVPRETVVVLPNVETFSLVMNDDGPGYEFAAHISCPSARHTSFTRDMGCDPILQELFPTSVLWKTIIRQYTKSPVEEVALEIKFPDDPIITCSLTFRSSNADVLSLDLQVAASDDDDDYYDDDDEYLLRFPSEDLHYEVFHLAFRTIRDHPLLTTIKRLHTDHQILLFSTCEFPRFSDEIGQLFKFVGPLEKLTIYGCDLHLYFNPTHNRLKFYKTERLVVFPQIRELVISHPLQDLFSDRTCSSETCVATIVELARSHHERGIPFERITLRMEGLPTVMAGRLAPWVGAVDCYEEKKLDSYYRGTTHDFVLLDA